MNVFYAQQALPRSSIFLAGPTPRKETKIPSWRPEGLRILEQELRFDGDVYVPEPANFQPYDSFDADVQVAWEWTGLTGATVVAFWIPRDLKDMPGYTTNIEWGLLVASGKVVLGIPGGAPGTGYIRKLAERFHVPVHNTLYDTLASAVERAARPFGHGFSTAN